MFQQILGKMQRAKRVVPRGYMHMFVEDMTNGVVSFYRRQRHDRKPVIFFEMDDAKALENKVSQMLGSNRGDFGDAVCELMRQTAWLLFLDGEAKALLNGFRNEGMI